VSISEENNGLAVLVSSGPHGATAGGSGGAYSSPMQASDSTFRGAGGIELIAHRWAPDGPLAPKAAVAIVHGFGEHSGRYGAVVSALTGRGFAVHGFDLRGHGRSPGRRGHISAWSEYRDDLAACLDHVQAREAPGTPVFLYGHSLGGAIVLEYGLRRPGGLAGVVASAPALEPKGVRSPALEALARLLSRAWPTFSLAVPLEEAALSRVPAAIEANRRDGLNHRRLTSRAVVETLAAMAWIKSNAPAWQLPLLVIHGTGDRLMDPDGSRAFVAATHRGLGTDVELRLYDGVYHEPHNDLEAARVLADVGAWLERHLPG
jgi:alpha-beta hydrolase superfamily lysophospholipase